MTAASSSPDSASGPVDWAAALAERRRWLRTVLLARLSDRQAVDEVLQEVALAAVRRGPQQLSEDGVSAWLYRVAVRQALLERRRTARADRRVVQYARRTEASYRSAGDPLRWLLAGEEAALVRAALLRLPGRDRELLLLKYTEDWSCKELSAHLGIKVTTVETRLFRARERLRHELSRLDIGPSDDHANEEGPTYEGALHA
jgi:RNA polymerase sigma-70 factor (ECF subfamily)